MISGFYAALLALMQIKLTKDVVKVRRGEKVSLGNGGHEALERKIRVHGNFVETVPIFLFLLLISELSGAPFWALHMLGILMIGARVAHAIGISSGTGHGKFRFYGMIGTLMAIALAAILSFWLSLPALIPLS